MYNVEFKFVFAYPMKDRKISHSVFSKKGELSFVPTKGMQIRFKRSRIKISSFRFTVENVVYDYQTKSFEVHLGEFNCLNQCDLSKYLEFFKGWDESEKSEREIHLH